MIRNSLSEATLHDLIAAQRTLAEAVDGLTRAVQERQQHDPRWWATPGAMAALTLLGILIALVSFVGDRLDASRDQVAPPEAPVMIPVAPSQDGR